MGQHNEHWQLHFHPQNKDDNAHWHRVHAVSSEAKHRGVLQTDHNEKGGPGHGYDPARQSDPGHHHMILGNFNNHDDAKKAAESLKGVSCTSKFPGQNCVDWTKHAVEKLHTEGHISEAHKDEFMAHYEKHAKNVREKTDTPKNRRAARGGTAYSDVSRSHRN